MLKFSLTYASLEFLLACFFKTTLFSHKILLTLYVLMYRSQRLDPNNCWWHQQMLQVCWLLRKSNSVHQQLQLPRWNLWLFRCKNGLWQGEEEKGKKLLTWKQSNIFWSTRPLFILQKSQLYQPDFTTAEHTEVLNLMPNVMSDNNRVLPITNAI